LLKDSSQALYTANPSQQLSELTSLCCLFFGQHPRANYWDKTKLYQNVYQEFLEKVKVPQKRKLFSHLALVGREEGLHNLLSKGDLVEMMKAK